jgi:hypothetical protein
LNYLSALASRSAAPTNEFPTGSGATLIGMVSTEPSRRSPGLLRNALQWALWLFALNLVWETGQLPLYAFEPDVSWIEIAYAVAHCTFGDAMVAFTSYVLGALWTRAPRWPLERPASGFAVSLASGLIWTVWAEWYNVYVLRSWAYASGMPTILGIGVSPVLQWVVLPALALVLVRKWTERSDRGN